MTYADTKTSRSFFDYEKPELQAFFGDPMIVEGATNRNLADKYEGNGIDIEYDDTF